MSYYQSMKNQKVLIVFHPSFPLTDSNPAMGFYPEFLNGSVAVTIKEVDELGIWIVNPELEIQDVASGNSSKYSSLVLIKWEYLLSIVRIPDREIPKTSKEYGFSPKQ